MKQWHKNLYALWLGSFVSSMCYTLVTPFMALFLKELNVTRGLEAWAGFAVSASFMTSALMSPVWGSLADRYGRKIMVIRSGIGQGIRYSLQFFVTDHYQLIALRMINGFFSGMSPACTALAATNTPEANIPMCLGILQTALATGGIMGPLFGGISAQFLGYRATFLGSGALLFIVTLLIAFTVKETAPRQRDSRVRIFQDLKVAMSNPALRTVLFTATLVQTSLTILQPVLSLQIVKLGQPGMASLAAGVVYSMAGIAIVIAAPLWAKRGERTGFKRVLVTGLTGASLLNVLLSVVRNLYVFGGLRFCVGLATGGATLSVNAIAAKSVEPGFRGRAFGILQSFHQTGSWLGPVLGGLTGSAMGLEATFILAAAMLLGTSFVAGRSLPSDTPAQVSLPA